ncbi:hypothetical protein PMAYCL1PPCAC_21563, partial [Pristionchus mayeri]
TVMSSITAADLVQYKGRYGELIAKAECPETRAVITALAYGSLADIPEERVKELPKEVLEYFSRVSLVHAVSKHGRTLDYDVLLPLLRLPSDAALEALVIDSIYEGICTATIDSSARKITISSWAAREADPSTISSMVNMMDQWMQASEAVIAQATDKAVEEDEKLAAAREEEKVANDEVLAARVALEEEYKEYKGQSRSTSRMGGVLG